MKETRALVEAYDAAQAAGERCAMATIVAVEGSSYRQPGTRMLVCESGATTGTISAGCLEGDVSEHARRAIRSGVSRLVEYDNRATSDELAWGLGLGCNGVVRLLVESPAAAASHVEALRRSLHVPVSLELRGPDGIIVFAETLRPPVPVVIFGAGPDVLPVVELARLCGWRTQIVDPRARLASRERFGSADEVTLARPDELPACVAVSADTMALVMSHDYADDRAVLDFLLRSDARFIGVMGPRQRTERMLRDIGAAPAAAERIHAPIGLDIGASGPHQIAVSIVAELTAVEQGRCGGMLRERRQAIHDRRNEESGKTRARGVVVAA